MLGQTRLEGDNCLECVYVKGGGRNFDKVNFKHNKEEINF